MKITALLILLAVAGSPLIAGDARAAAADQAELRATLFGGADAALKAANEAQASLLAPRSYADGAEAYRRAESILESAGGIDAIRRNLSRAEEAFSAAAESAQAARARFETALQAREDASSAESERYAEDGWQDAERSLTEAAERLERGRESRADRAAEQARELYRAAELAAIEANYLSDTRSLLETADDLRAGRYAPISYDRARELLAQAEQSLREDRYDTDRPRNLAQTAEHNAHHAIYVSRLQQQVNDGDTSLEEILLDWEAAIGKLADQLDVPVYFDAGHGEAIKKMSQAIATLQADIDFLEQANADRDAQIASLKLEVGDQSQNLERMNEALARRERQRERFERVEALFEEDQAIVLRQSDSVILRLIGLNFASGSARLGEQHQEMLTIVEQALSEFPEANIVIEGHTDSFGSDTSNQELSQARADAVLRYLLDNTPISPADARALGYGEGQPVANNETPEGRARNRRIDIVIYPRW
ncbi:MAG: OmpA family protein [Gammaproteobacteria bacterium]|nr:OmpA family protein [Gammaproteobacteria bacterium]